VDQEELINFGSHPLPDPDQGIFKKNSSTVGDKAFSHKLAHISGKTEHIFMKMLS